MGVSIQQSDKQCIEDKIAIVIIFFFRRHTAGPVKTGTVLETL